MDSSRVILLARIGASRQGSVAHPESSVAFLNGELIGVSKLKTKELVLNDVTYTIKEPTVGVLFPIMDLMETDPKQFQMELAKASIFVNGLPIGDKILELGLGDYLKLIQAVIELSGLGGNLPNV